MNQITTVIFDLDGTLLYTLEDLQGSVNYALSQMNYALRNLEEVRHFVGHGVYRLIERAVPDGTSREEIDRTFEIFREHYSKNCNVTTRAYDGILDLLTILKEKGYHLAIVSNKMDSAVKALNEIYFNTWISVAIGATDTVRKKPAPDTVFAAMKELGVSPKETIYVGDSEVDIETAKNAGIPCISCKWGFRDLEVLEEAGATMLVDRPDEILSLLEA